MHGSQSFRIYRSTVREKYHSVLLENGFWEDGNRIILS
ncbi:hypothetical protein CES85_3597 (plasmid) [Ochrobactrum quorumnocens]|uniref:Uncharacterized protein n=1 Tax=Ochrobactrum quorumnocens TaxID=271865 RepID=A0A248UPM1_9HYPH|nr:hypothetical protein CES85_3597 [[Ochrobactrum] quorumnocens]